MKPYTQMTSNELLQELKNRPNLLITEDIIKEAYKKNYYPVLEFASKNTFLMETLELSNIVLDYIILKSNGVGKNLLYILLNLPKRTVDQLPQPKLNDVCNKNPTLSAVALLSQNTPYQIVNTIITKNNLTDSILSPFYTTNEQMAKQLNSQNPILTEITKLLRLGWQWSNEQSGIILISRFSKNYKDKFLEEVTNKNLSSEIAYPLLRSIEGLNEKLTLNLKNNEYEGVKKATLFHEFYSKSENEDIIPFVVRHIMENKNPKEIEWLWNFTVDKMSKDPSFNLDYILSHDPNNNLFVAFAKKNISIASLIIKMIKDWVSKTSQKTDSPAIEEIIHLGLMTPSLRDLTLSIPKDVFDHIRMSPSNRQLVEEKYPEIEQENTQQKIMENIFANKKTNWYQKYSESTNIIIQEAGWKENITTSLLASLVLILGGSTVKNASDKMKLKEEQVVAAMSDPSLMEQAKQIARTNQPQITEPFGRSMSYTNEVDNGVDNGVDTFMKEAFDYIKEHEGLELKPYPDSGGNMTIGIGHKILPNENFSQGITENQALSLFKKDIQKHLAVAKRIFPSFDSYPNKVKVALLDGVFRGDHKSDYKTTYLINNNQWERASLEYLKRSDYNRSKAEDMGIHKRMEENAKIMAQYGKELKHSK